MAAAISAPMQVPSPHPIPSAWKYRVLSQKREVRKAVSQNGYFEDK
jgi:hypothetical protein